MLNERRLTAHKTKYPSVSGRILWWREESDHVIKIELSCRTCGAATTKEFHGDTYHVALAHYWFGMECFKHSHKTMEVPDEHV